MRKTLPTAVFIMGIFACSAAAEPMRFEFVGSGGNCGTCNWIQATGEITINAPDYGKASLGAAVTSLGA